MLSLPQQKHVKDYNFLIVPSEVDIFTKSNVIFNTFFVYGKTKASK